MKIGRRRIKFDQSVIWVWVVSMLLPIVVKGQLLDTEPVPVAEWSMEDILTTPPLRASTSTEPQEVVVVPAPTKSNTAPDTVGESSSTVVAETPEEEKGFVAGMIAKAKAWWSGDEKKEPEKPAFVASNEGQEAQKNMSDVLEAAKSRNAIQVSGGRAGDASIPKTRLGVPSFNLVNTKKITTKSGETKTVRIPVTDIPSLDIGQEPVVSPTAFVLPDSRMAEVQLKKVQPLSTPELMNQQQFAKFLGEAIEKIGQGEKFKLARLDKDKQISMDTVEQVTYVVNDDAVVHELAFQELSETDELALKAFLLVEYGDKCHAAAGLLNDLSRSGDKTYKQAADFHLSICLHKMGLFSESIDRLMTVLKGPNPEYRVKGVEVLLKELPKDFETRIVRDLKSFPENEVPEKLRDQFNYKIGKASARLGHYNTAKKFAARVPKGSERYHDAQFVQAIAEYALGDRQSSFERQKQLVNEVSRNGKKKNLRDLASLNLARMSFQTKQYDTAIENFNEIKKDHPLWVQALNEQGWTQIQMGDYAGAIGNMYSLHSTYFQAAYKPESYVVRTIGYLNICQYGDARRSLEYLENSHRPWYNAVSQFRKTNTTNLSHYDAMTSYLQNPKQKIVKGLPFQVLREMGRHRDYLNLQENINNRVDEMGQYKFLSGIINKDIREVKWFIRKSRERLAEYKANIKRAKSDNKYAPTLNENILKLKNEKRQERYLLFQLAVYQEAKKSFNEFQSVAVKQLSADKRKLRLAAGKVLKDRLAGIQGQLKRVLENNELLRYEILAGSGENIRFQAAGGQKRIPANVVKKDLNWNFEGEIWEDEIGHYRSKLVNMCPKRAAAR